MALGVALLSAHIPSPWMWLIVLLLIISGVASLGLVWYPMDAPGPATILAMPIDRGHGRRRSATCGCPGISIAVRTDPAWSGLFMTALVMFLLL